MVNLKYIENVLRIVSKISKIFIRIKRQPKNNYNEMKIFYQHLSSPKFIQLKLKQNFLLWC